MTVLVLSDSHRDLGSMIQAVERTQPQRLLHLGDLLSDAEELRHVFPDLSLTGVPGNCDGWTGAMEERLLTLEGHRLLLGHGHQWGVKSSPAGACRAARMEGAKLILFGHTHTPLCRREEDGLWVVNPGSIRDTGSYALLQLEQGRDPRCTLHTL